MLYTENDTDLCSQLTHSIITYYKHNKYSSIPQRKISNIKTYHFFITCLVSVLKLCSTQCMPNVLGLIIQFNII